MNQTQVSQNVQLTVLTLADMEEQRESTEASRRFQMIVDALSKADFGTKNNDEE